MPRLAKPKIVVKKPDKYVTLVGDILPNKDWVIPDRLRVDEVSPRTDTGIIQFEINEQPIVLSRSGLNIGVDANLLPEILDSLDELGFTSDFTILDTGTNDGSQPEHYTKQDYQILQGKIGPSAYLTKFNPSLTKKYPN